MHKSEPAFGDEIEAAAERVLGLGRKTGDQVRSERHLGTEVAGPAGERDRLLGEPLRHVLEADRSLGTSNLYAARVGLGLLVEISFPNPAPD